MGDTSAVGSTFVNMQILNDQPLELPTLPDEVWLYIFQYFGLKDILSLSLVDKTFYQLASDSHIWKVFCQAHPHFEERGEPDYRKVYLECACLERNLRENQFLVREHIFPDGLLNGLISNGLICFRREGGVIEIYDLESRELKHQLNALTPSLEKINKVTFAINDLKELVQSVQDGNLNQNEAGKNMTNIIRELQEMEGDVELRALKTYFKEVSSLLDYLDPFLIDEIDESVSELDDDFANLCRHAEKLEESKRSAKIVQFAASSKHIFCGHGTGCFDVYERETGAKILTFASHNNNKAETFFKGEYEVFFIDTAIKLFVRSSGILTTVNFTTINFLDCIQIQNESNIEDCFQLDSENLLYLRETTGSHALTKCSSGSSYLSIMQYVSLQGSSSFALDVKTNTNAFNTYSIDGSRELVMYQGNDIVTTSDPIVSPSSGPIRWHLNSLWLEGEDDCLYRLDKNTTFKQILPPKHFKKIHFWHHQIYGITQEGNCEVVDFAATPQEIKENFARWFREENNSELTAFMLTNLGEEVLKNLSSRLTGTPEKRRRLQ